MFRVIVKLVKQSTDRFTGHSVVAGYKRQAPASGGSGLAPILPAETSAPVGTDDRAKLEFPDKNELVGDILLRALAPDGEVQASVLVAVTDLTKEIELKAEPKRFAATQPSDDPGFGKPAKLRGRVIDRAGRQQIGGVQVVLFGKGANRGAKPAPVLVADTDPKGYFSGPYPVEVFAEVHGVVGVVDQPTVPVALNADGRLPQRVILVVDLPKDAELDTGAGAVPRLPDNDDRVVASETFTQDLGGGRCIDFHKPNRTIETFDYFSVVRTTEPAIKGLTLTEPPRIPLKTVLDLVRPKTFRLLEAEGASAQPTRGRTAVGRRTAAVAEAVTTERGTESLAANLASVLDLSEIDALSERIEAAAANAAAPDAAEFKELGDVEIEADIAAVLADDPDGFSLTRLASAELATNARRLGDLLDRLRIRTAGRGELDCDVAVDWDLTPTIYQACEVAHGHILNYRQEWIADGYSLGDLVCSLPLGPCQKKNIVVLDWERRESSRRTESLQEQEQLSAFLSRDRDISEITQAVVSEEMEGGSSASTGAFGGGAALGFIGGAVGGLVGIGGGFSSADATAWQNASRETAASNLQKLSDRTRQAASAIRSQRSTVIQTVRQGESVRVETEVVANHNHCHALTIEYFEVLRHFVVRHKLVDVRECLFVPLLMSRFDGHKALRWRETLTRFLRDRRLAAGFDAVERIVNNYAGSDLPTGSFAEEDIEAVDGFLRITFRFTRPRDDEDGKFVASAWEQLERLLGFDAREFHATFLEGQTRRDRIFAEQLGGRIAAAIVDSLQISFDVEASNQVPLRLDATLISSFANGTSHYVSLRQAEALPTIRRADIRFVRISARTLSAAGSGTINLDQALPPGSRVVVDGGQMRYRTAHLGYDLFHDTRVQNDLGGGDDVLIFTPLSRRELENPRAKDKELARRLLKHLNEHLEFYHRALFACMDAGRRWQLLDGFIAPNSNGRSIASVVENRLIGIVGNSLVMPVAPGFRLDPTFEQDAKSPVDLFEHYQPLTPEAPLSMAVPTKGVFAEAVMGACNSCEEIDESRFWRWEESPCPDEPTAIQPVSLESRRAEPPELTPTQFPTPLINLQNAPSAPDPAGLAAALALLGTPNLFRDVTGLSETQKNALAGLQAALATAAQFGQGAAGLATTGAQLQGRERMFSAVKKALKEELIDADQASKLFEQILLGGQQVTPDKSKETKKQIDTTEKKLEAFDKARNAGQIPQSAGEQLSIRTLEQLIDDTEMPLNPVELENLAEAAGKAKVNLKQEKPSGEMLEALSFPEGPGGAAGALGLQPAAFNPAQMPLGGSLINLLEQNFRNRSSDLRSAISNAQRIELEFWENNGAQLDEKDPAVLSRLEDYARAARSANPAAEAAKFASSTTFWSAAFVSYVLEQAGVTAQEFHFNIAHDEYIKVARNNREAGDFLARYWLCALDEAVPDIGDILCSNRSGGNVRYDPGIPGGGLPKDFVSHGDIVTGISVNSAGAPVLVTIGGNVGGSVRRRFVPVDANFKITATSHQGVEPANRRPQRYFAVVRMRSSLFETYP